MAGSQRTSAGSGISTSTCRSASSPPRSSSSGPSALLPLAAALREGASLIVFPEGTRHVQLLPATFRSGLFHLARDFPAVELVPVYLDNLHRAWPKGALLPVPVSTGVLFGAPLRVGPGDASKPFLARAREAVIALGRTAHPEATLD